MSIYTKTGDGGYTTTLKEKHVAKSSGIISLLGKIDEVNAIFGLVACAGKINRISEIQNRLFDIGAWIANINPQDISDLHNLEPLLANILNLESDIDTIDSIMPPLRNFILPGGNELAARLHIARCVTRCTEHDLWLQIPIKTNIHIYINRLSDWCFMQARYALYEAKLPEVIWEKI